MSEEKHTTFTLDQMIEQIEDRRFTEEDMRTTWSRVEKVKQMFDEGELTMGDALVLYHEEDAGLAYCLRIPLRVLFRKFQLWQIVALNFQSTAAFRQALLTLGRFRTAKFAVDHLMHEDPTQISLFCEWYGYG